MMSEHDKVDFVAKLISETDPFIEQVQVKDGLHDGKFGKASHLS